MSRPFFFGGNQSSQQNQYLVQMKAGKMVRNGSTVTPVKDKKGLVYLHQSSDDSLMHFCWKDRTSGQLEDDLIIFPDDAEFLKVSQCTTGRVFVLKFKTSPRRLFFWSQEPKDDKDEELVSKINEYINNPVAASRANSHGGGASGGGGSGGGHNLMSSNDLGLNTDEELRNLFAGSNVSAQQLMSMLDSGMSMLPGTGRLASLLNPSMQQTTTTTTTTSTSSSVPANNRLTSQQSSNVSTPAAPQTPSTTPAIAGSGSNSNSESSSTTGGNNSPGGPPGLRLADLQNIISGLTSSGQHLIVPEGADLNVDLSTSITVEVLRPLLNNEDFMKRISDMLPQLPPSSTTPPPPLAEQFISTVQSPQFQQALNSFSRALQSGQLGPLVQQFGLPQECVNAANNGDFEAFVKALQANRSSDKAKPKTTPKEAVSEANKKPDQFDDDSMALD